MQVTQENFTQAVRRAADTLKSGGVIVYPTDTAYGFGANGLSSEAIDKVFTLKGRPRYNPMNLVARNIDSVADIAELSAIQKSVLACWLPGPVTFVLGRKPIVPSCLVNGEATVGIRIPKHPVTSLLSEYVEFPYTTTSANLSNYPTVYSISALCLQFPPSAPIDLVLDYGELKLGAISTVIDISNWPQYKIVREGVLPSQEFSRWATDFVAK